MARKRNHAVAPGDVLLDRRAVAERLGMTPRNFDRQRKAGTYGDALPTVWPTDASPRWRAGDVDALLASRTMSRAELKRNQTDHVNALLAALETAMGREITGITVTLTDSEAAAARDAVRSAKVAEQQNASDDLAAAFAKLDPVRAMLVTGGLMPSIRSLTDEALRLKTGAVNKASQDDLRSLAIDIVDQALSGEFVDPNADKQQ